MKKYCFDCGAKMEFSASSKPKFCPNCGISLGSPSSQSTPQEKVIEDHDDEEIDDISNLNINALDFDFDESLLQVKGQKIENVMGTGAQTDDSIPNVKPADYGKEDFQKEAGTLRNNKPEGNA
tara:strand:+ start:2808 stop:3176 length:369 start_codon:yes stop_codon:yes gene_type:complete